VQDLQDTESSQVKYIYIALFTIQIAHTQYQSKQFNSVCLLLEKRHPSLVISLYRRHLEWL